MTIQESRSKEYPAEVKKQIGQWLRAAPRGSQKIVAQALNVTDRTLRSWKKLTGAPKKRGRKKKEVSLREKKLIAREWVQQGFTGSRPVIKALPSLQVRGIQRMVKEMKLRRRRRALENRMRVQIRMKVNKVGVVVAMDGATIEKGDDLVVYRDRGSLSVQAEACAGALRSVNTLETLLKMKNENRLPLVLCTDNGSPFCSSAVASFLEDNKIIHLRSLPRVPQHNGSCENAVKEIKQLLLEGLGVEEACRTLNEGRKRQSLLWKTSAEVDSESRSPYDDERRQEFYEKAVLAINKAKLGTKSGLERRKAEREAIMQTMESFELITRTRGGQTCA